MPFYRTPFYSPNSNLFPKFFTLKFEMSLTGFVRTIYDVETARLIYVEEKRTALLLVVMIFFMVTVFVLLVKLLLRITKKRELILRDVWILVDLIIISMSVALFWLFVNRSVMIGVFLDRIEKRNIMNLSTIFIFFP
ncbi:hypothetical protein JTB14_024220 [Gonioctena quinquepunctata]|nr:hypothetical protein JTB14_024220 [Gonioctena quinquepunctata]